jgi:hypothetical protein
MTRGKGKAPGDYDVGFGKPPRHTQFPRGRSGNPNGRPPRARSKHSKLAQAMDQPTREMFLAEMYRPIAVMVDGRKVHLPANQMIVRSMVKTAASGGQQAQRTALLVQLELERELAQERAELMATTREAKAMAETMHARCRARGLPEPDLLPHPDDIHIDEEHQTVEIRGPRTPEQKAALDKILAERDGYQRGVTGLQREAAEKPRDWTLPMLAVMAQERFDIINDRLPERYQKRLENRMSLPQIEAAREKARKGSAPRKRRRASARGRKNAGAVTNPP